MRAPSVLVGWAGVAVAALLPWCLAGEAFAQEVGFRTVASPFQQEFDYTIGDELRPQVEVDGVRWIRFAVTNPDERDVPSDKPVPVEIALELRGGDENAKVQLVVLFEDEHGRPLHRLSCDPVKTGRERVKEIVQRHKVPGAALELTRKVYLYFEVIR
ncbi:MAG TPA: hypothetical protein VLT81_09755 [Chondromyces sp.]|nr:hypothetical protein [Chondromyces sp.]